MADGGEYGRNRVPAETGVIIVLPRSILALALALALEIGVDGFTSPVGADGLQHVHADVLVRPSKPDISPILSLRGTTLLTVMSILHMFTIYTLPSATGTTPLQ